METAAWIQNNVVYFILGSELLIAVAFLMHLRSAKK